MFNPRSSCGNKIRHMSKAQAKLHIEMMNRVYGRKPHKLQAYHCVYCSFWHIGHKPGTKRPPKGEP